MINSINFIPEHNHLQNPYLLDINYIETPDIIIPLSTLSGSFTVYTKNNKIFPNIYAERLTDMEEYYISLICGGINIYTCTDTQDGEKKFNGCILHTEKGKLYIYT
jgi:hypothetical protein